MNKNVISNTIFVFFSFIATIYYTWSNDVYKTILFYVLLLFISFAVDIKVLKISYWEEE